MYLRWRSTRSVSRALDEEDQPMQFATRAQVAPEARRASPTTGAGIWSRSMPDAALGVVLRNASFEQVAESRAEAWEANRWAEAEGAAVVTACTRWQADAACS